jgi:Cof subfamily protein (haloacid dehalogenase superfamily)
MIRLVASDLDGTLLKGDGTISPQNIETIQALNQKGIVFTAASGRNYTGVHALFAGKKVSYEAILANGAEYVDEEGMLLSTRYFNKKIVKELLQLFDFNGIPSMMFTTAGVCTHMDEESGRNAYRKRMLARQGFRREDLEKPEVIRSIPAMHMTGIRYVDALLKSDTEILKLECYDMEQDQMIQIGNALKKYPDIVYFSSAGDNYEITDAAATKGKILLEQCERKGIRPDEVLVIGDGLNDLSMFASFPHSVCVSDGMAGLKEKAEWIAPAASEDGFAAAVKHYIVF